MAPLRVVIADDSDAYRTALYRVLDQKPKVTVIAAAQDGVEALALVQATHPDVLLLDIEMPKMDGWAVLRHLQETASPPRVFVLSSYAGSYFRDRALAEGASAYFNKGEPQQVLDAMDALLDTGFAPV